MPEMEIAGRGTYTYDQDVYDDIMKSKADDILARLIEWNQLNGEEPGDRTQFRAMKKGQRAAILAWWETMQKNRNAEEQHEAHMDAVAEENKQYLQKLEERSQLLDDEIQDFHNEQSDAELIEFTREVMESSGYTMPITETNCITPTGKALLTLVQIGSKLFWGTLVAVVNRRTKFCEPLLCNVEIDGVRRLVDANHVLAGDVLKKVG